MFDTGAQAMIFLKKKFPNKQFTKRQKQHVFTMMNRAAPLDERKAARDLLTDVLGINPMFEIDWARLSREKPELLIDPVGNRRLLYDGFYNGGATKTTKDEAKREFIDRLGRHPFKEDAPMHYA